MRLFLPAVLIAASLAFSGLLSAQLNFPEIPFDSVEPLTFPENIHMGEAAGVATNSNGDVFVYTRTGTPVITIAGARNVSHGGSRLFKFDRNGTFVREMGQNAYGFLQAQQVRVDAEDNIWIVDQMSTQVVKFDPDGRIQMVLSRKPEAMRVPEAPMYPRPDTYALVPPQMPEGGIPAGRGSPPDGSGMEGERFVRPTDVAWDSQGNIYVADGYGNARIAKFDRNGKWIRNWGKRGSAPGEFNIVHGIAIDAEDNVYVADRENKRIQVFDMNGNFKTQFRNVGSPWAICMTPGPGEQFLYVSNSNAPYQLEYDGEIIKMTLDGQILGKFGRAGKLLKEFGTVNAIDCRTENELYVGELLNWRVQKLTLRP